MPLEEQRQSELPDSTSVGAAARARGRNRFEPVFLAIAPWFQPGAGLFGRRRDAGGAVLDLGFSGEAREVSAG